MTSTAKDLELLVSKYHNASCEVPIARERYNEAVGLRDRLLRDLATSDRILEMWNSRLIEVITNPKPEPWEGFANSPTMESAAAYISQANRNRSNTKGKLVVAEENAVNWEAFLSRAVELRDSTEKQLISFVVDNKLSERSE